MPYPVMSTSVPWSLVKGGFKKTPHFNSVPQKTAAGRGYSTLALQPYATWDFDLDLNVVLGGESIAGSVLQSFLGCYLAACGGGGFFLFTDPNDNALLGTLTPDELLLEDGASMFLLEGGTDLLLMETSGGSFGIMLNVTPGAATPMGVLGDGVSTQFQLARPIGQGVDILQQVTLAQVLVNGVATSAYSVSSTGVVTFSTAPPLGATLTWGGTFQYLCRFTEDTLPDLARVNKNSGGWLWSCSSIKFESIFL